MNVDQLLRIKGTDVVTVSPDTNITEAAGTLRDNKIGIVVVCRSGGRLVGVLSERDLVSVIADFPEQAASLKVESIMTPDVATCGPGDDLDSVLALMNEGGIRHAPVVEYGHLKGLVSSHDLLKHLLNEHEMDDKASDWAGLDFL